LSLEGQGECSLASNGSFHAFRKRLPFSWQQPRNAVLGTIARICPQWSKPLPSKPASGWCWRMLNSTAREITPTFGRNLEPECDPRQAREENLAHARRACRNAGEHSLSNSIDVVL